MASYTPATGHKDYPASRYPLVSGAEDEKLARDAYASLNTLLDYRASQLPNDLCLCPIDLDKGTCAEYTFVQTRQLVISIAAAFAPVLPVRTVNDPALVVAMSGRSGGDYWVLEKAIQRLGHIPLHLSTTLTPSAALSLIKLNNPSHTLLGPGSERLQGDLCDHLQPLAALKWQTIQGHLDSLSWTKQHTEEMSTEVTAKLQLDVLANQPCLICHTTGSTADPKSITMPNKCLLSNTCRGLCDSKLLITPLAHGYAFLAAIFSLAGGKPIFVYPGAPYTAENLLRTIEIVSGKVDNFAAVPMFIKLLSSVPGGLDRLKGFKRLTMCGGQLSDQLMEQLAARGIPVWNAVQGSEVGHMLDSGEPKVEGWDWMNLPKDMDRYLVMEPYEDEGYELVIQKGYPSLFVFNRQDGYGTKDLYVRHPDDPRKWKYLKRKDDIIVHSIGLKTDPIFMEHFLLASPQIKNVMIFGQGEPVAGALIIPSSESVTEADVQPLIDDLNDRLPSQSRLRPGLWRIFRPTDELYVSPKGTVVRKKTAEKWKDVIEDMYERAGPEVSQLQAGTTRRQ